MTEAMCELDITELDFVAGGYKTSSLGKAIVTGVVAAVCKSSAEAFIGGLATGLETGGIGFLVAAAGGLAAAACAYGMLSD